MITKICASLLGVLLLAPMPAFAARELFTAPLPAFNAIEPASGAAASPSEPAQPAEASATEGHDEGHSESTSTEPAQHSPDEKPKAKKRAGPAPLPTVRIGGAVVQRAAAAFAASEATVLPEALNNKTSAPLLQQRLSLTPFAHSPRHGPNVAQLSIVVFEDLACISCTAASLKITEALQQFFIPPAVAISGTEVSFTTQILWVHAQSQRFGGTNLPAFYAKVAARQGKFWEYREGLLATQTRNTDSAFGVLSSLGLEPRTTRQIMLAEARRFYRELDGDSQLARSIGIGKPPSVLVSGIRVGEHGVALELLPDVIQYVSNRLKAGMTEPPR